MPTTTKKLEIPRGVQLIHMTGRAVSTLIVHGHNHIELVKSANETLIKIEQGQLDETVIAGLLEVGNEFPGVYFKVRTDGEELQVVLSIDTIK